MEVNKFSNGGHTTKLESALKRFENVCNSLEYEHKKLLELEEKRKQLQKDLERLQIEIKEKNKHFPPVRDEHLKDFDQSCSRNQLNELVEPATLDTGASNLFTEDLTKYPTTDED